MSTKTNLVFEAAFKALTGNAPFPWQAALYQRFVRGEFPSCNIPTGLGKTGVIATWLIAVQQAPRRVPRRLVYVVNRRTVVDQTTVEAEKLRRNAAAAGLVVPAISTLRGQFADNRQWSADPSIPAIVCGTVDMIGSRLLFSGYGVGYRARPLHAGFLGQDALLVHDEAHLEPAFQTLLDALTAEQSRCAEFARLRVMTLSATPRDTSDVLRLSEGDLNNDTVKERIRAKKKITLLENKDPKKLADEIADLALKHRSDQAILVFVQKIEDVEKVAKRLPPSRYERLTGTLRGFERDSLVLSPVFQRFLPPQNRDPQITPTEGAVYLVCTSAGEVGINISADHLVCDLSTFESMVQRFGRVNRFGCPGDHVARIDVVHHHEFDKNNELDNRRRKTLELLRKLKGDASPEAIEQLPASSRTEAFAPPPMIPEVSDALFDAWALTTIRKPMPGRQPVAPYLHGITDRDPPETHVAWREEVEVIAGDLLRHYPPEDLLDDYPLKPHELLRDRSDRVFTQLKAIGQEHPDKPVWVVDDRDTVLPTTLGELAKLNKGAIDGCFVLLPPSAGGLNDGMLDSRAQHPANDIADQMTDEQGRVFRKRQWDDKTVPAHLQLLRVIDTRPDVEEDDEGQKRYWYWYDLPREGGRTSTVKVSLEAHVGQVVDHAQAMVDRLVSTGSLPSDIAPAIVLAARLHDEGKRRELFQLSLGNRNFEMPLAKSGRAGARLPEPFRHEFASVIDAQGHDDVRLLSPDLQDLVLHLIAAHHGRARPHFSIDEAFDPESPADARALSIETPRRFARLQHRYGRWGLAYLESLLRAADWQASAFHAEHAEQLEAVS